MRSRIGQLSPSPLEQVHVLSFRLSERFWRDTLRATEQQVRYVHEHGTFLGSVKMEMWRSHIAITVTELLPQSKSAGWQTRTIDLYAADSSEPAVLWELCVPPEANSSVEEASFVQLRYEGHSVILAARAQANTSWPQSVNTQSTGERIVFCIPLDAEQLAEFRVREADVMEEESGTDADVPLEAGDHPTDANVSSFSCRDEGQGVDWQLHIRDLNGRPASENWTVMEPPRVRRVS